MVDAISAFFHQLKGISFDEDYRADRAITGRRFEAYPHSRQLMVIFPPWHMPGWFEKALVAHLQKKGMNVLLYSFSGSILSADVLRVKSSFEYIALEVTQEVRELCKQHSIEKVHLLSLSLGAVGLALTTEKLDTFDSTTLVVPGSDLADAVVHGKRTAKLAKLLKEEGFRLNELEQEWSLLAPISHTETLASKPIRIILSHHDQFIPTSNGLRLVEKLKEKGADITLKFGKGGHLSTILDFERHI